MLVVVESNERRDRVTKNFLIMGSRIVLRRVESLLVRLGGDWMLVVFEPNLRERNQTARQA